MIGETIINPLGLIERSELIYFELIWISKKKKKEKEEERKGKIFVSFESSRNVKYNVKNK